MNEALPNCGGPTMCPVNNNVTLRLSVGANCAGNHFVLAEIMTYSYYIHSLC